ncbi:MAG: hypothetical protein A3H27_07670 [Acidobacteria bacterium RIFCSPLOWO2_02_FULL_59_13]|nr:MAG: hypothetical protein A3H27_07670 [Acidobacteria bacterium RIFCSPLOWO2_02_FULL_59_13]
MAKGKKIRVLIADRRAVLRLGLEQLLSREPDVSVVGQADGGRQTLKMVSELKPAILLLGLLPDGMAEMDLLRDVQRKCSATRVILLHSLDNEEDAVQAVRLGTTGILPRQATVRNLTDCIRKAEAGGVCVDAHLTTAASHPAAAAIIPNSLPQDASPLSLRERQVVGLVSQGFKNREIAQRMFISEQTVKNHMHNIFDKVGVSDRLELALYAIHKSTQPEE